MRKILLSPKWWGLHLFVIVVVLVFLRLGLWQWDRAQSSHGGIQNWAYAFQWPLFAGFGLVLWWKTLKIEAAAQDDETGAAPRPLSRGPQQALPEPQIQHRDGVRVGVTASAVDLDEDDAEVVSYNVYLAQLNARAAAVAARRPSR